MDEVEIKRSAKQLIDQYGLDASVQAALKADAMLARGDLEEFNLWMRIGRVVEDMQANSGGTTN